MADNGQGVIVQMSAQDADLVAAWQRARQGPQQFGDEVEKAGRKGKKAGQEIKEGMSGASGVFSSVIQNIAGAVQGVASFQTALQLVRSELDAISQKQQEIAGIQKGIAGTQRKAFDALSPKADLSLRELRDVVSNNSSISQAESFSAVAAALKEAGGGESFSAKRATETALIAGEFAPHADTAKRDAIASGAVTAQKLDSSLTPRQAVAQLVQMSRASESDLGEVSESLLPGIGRMDRTVKGATTGDLAAFALAIESTQDKGIGAATSTAEKVLSTLSKEGVTGTLDEQLAKLRGDKKLQKKVQSRLTRDPGALTAVTELINGGDSAQVFTDLRGKLAGSPEEVEAREASRREAIGKTPEQATSGLERTRKSSSERLATLQSEEGTKAEATAMVMDALRLTGTSAVRQGITYSMRGVASAMQSDEDYFTSSAGLIGQREQELSGLNGRNLADPITAAIVEELKVMKAALIQQAEAMAARDNTPIKVEVISMPADTKSQRAPINSLNDRR